jgi:hypothetical protein
MKQLALVIYYQYLLSHEQSAPRPGLAARTPAPLLSLETRFPAGTGPHTKNRAMPSGSLVFSSDVVYHGMSQEARQSWVNQAQEKLLLRKINLPTGTSIRSEQYFLISYS